MRNSCRWGRLPLRLPINSFMGLDCPILNTVSTGICVDCTRRHFGFEMSSVGGVWTGRYSDVYCSIHSASIVNLIHKFSLAHMTGQILARFCSQSTHKAATNCPSSHNVHESHIRKQKPKNI